jgi:hypothetical protein
MKIRKRKLALITAVSIAALLIIIRILMPYGIKWYLNNRVLNDMDVYRGQVHDVDLALWRGAYAIDSLVIVKKETELDKPFIKVPRIDLSIQWEALLNMEIVGEVICQQAVVNFAFSETAANAQTGEEEDWTAVVKELIPIRINHFEIVNGQIALTNVLAKPSTDLPLREFNLSISNIQNVYEKGDSLPSSIVATGLAPDYGGRLDFKANAMLLKQHPDFDYELSFEEVNLTTLNPIAKYYTDMDFEEGTISLYSEMAMKDQAYTGYVKPLIKDMKIFKWKEGDRTAGQWLKEFFGEGIQEIFENQKREQFATKVPIEGKLQDVKTNIWLTILNAFKNAYINAFEYELDQSIDFGDIEVVSK